MFFFIVLLLLFFELAVRILTSAGFLHHVNYGFSGTRPQFLDDINRDFGVWHYPNAVADAKRECFDVVYRSNSCGAVDKERSLKSDKTRVVVLGDSFVEGFGVNAEDRFTDILESRTGVEHLNFGTSGNFGSIQEMMLYKTMASKFDHNAVYVFALPDNDFKDNSPRGFMDGIRYRPYYDKNFNIYYPVEFEKRFDAGMSFSARVRDKLSNKIHTFNQIRQLLDRMKSSDIKRQGVVYAGLFGGEINGKRAGKKSKYYEYSQIDMDRLIRSYEDIAAAAEGRPVFIFTIPRYQDIYRFDTTKEAPPVARDLKAFADKHENVFYYDLLDGIVSYDFKDKTVTDMFHTCDGHWSPYGHMVAAELVQRYVSDVSDKIYKK